MKLELSKAEVPEHLHKYFTKKPAKYKSGDLINIPHLVADAMQEDGWILRQDIIWAKPAPMPESVKNRCTKAHEYLFLFVKKMGYYYDAEAIKEKQSTTYSSSQFLPNSKKDSLSNGKGSAATKASRANGSPDPIDGNRNKRSVWTVSSQVYEGAHFATYPPKLIEPCIKAGTSEHGACASCGAPWRRVVEETKLTRERPNDYVKRKGEEGTGNSCANSVAGVSSRTVGWEPTCRCGIEEVWPCIVLDPFMGSGTTGVVCLDLERWCWGIDLSEKYLRDNAIPRLEGTLLSRPGYRHLLARR